MLATLDPTTQRTIVVAGIDTHRSTHHVAVLTLNGITLADREFPVHTTGYAALLDWVSSFGVIDAVGIELTGSYGAGLTRYLQLAGVNVLEVNTTDKATRAKRGKDDAIDAVAAAQKVLSRMATAIPKDTHSAVESLRVLKVARDSAVHARTKALNQLKDLRITAPANIREPLEALTLPAVAKKVAAYRLDYSQISDPGQAIKIAMSRLGKRVRALTEEITATDKDLRALTRKLAPTLLKQPGIGVQSTTQFLLAVGSNIDRITHEAAFARMCGAAPIPVSSGKTNRMRLHRGGNRQANSALHIVIIGRLKHHQDTKDYVARKVASGASKRDAIRSLKRYLARTVFKILETDLKPV